MNDVKLLLSDLHPDVGDLFQTARTQVELTTMVRTIVFLRKRFPGIADLMSNPDTSEDVTSASVPPASVKRAPEIEYSYRVILRSSGKENKINVIKAVREITSHGLKQAKDICDDADEGKYGSNTVLRSGLSMEKALEIQARIEGLGGTVTIE